MAGVSGVGGPRVAWTPNGPVKSGGAQQPTDRFESNADELPLQLIPRPRPGAAAGPKAQLYELIERIQRNPQPGLADFQRLESLAQELAKTPGLLTAGDISQLSLAMTLSHKSLTVEAPKDPNMPFMWKPATVHSVGGTLMGLLYQTAKSHPDPKLREQALLQVAAQWPPESRARLLAELGAPDLKERAIREGGKLGEVMAPTQPDGPVHEYDLKNLQSAVQSDFSAVLKACEDEEELAKLIQALPPGPERDLLLSQPKDTRADLRTLRHGLMALQLADDKQWQSQNGKTVHKDRAERMVNGMMLTPRVAALMRALQNKNAAASGLTGKAAENRKYLQSDAFLDKVRMLGRPGDKGLNSKQMALIMEQVSRTVAGEENHGAGEQRLQELTQEVLQRLESKGVSTVSVSEAEVASMRGQISEALADPKLSPEERNALMELLPLINNAKNVASNSYKIVQVLRRIQPATLASVGRASGTMAKTLTMGSVILKWLGPVGDAWGTVNNIKEMHKAISEGDATTAQLRLGAAAAGGAAAAFGLATLCLVSGPPGWIAGGLSLIAAGLGVASYFTEEDPFEQDCKRWNLVTPGLPWDPERDRRRAEERQKDQERIDQILRGDYLRGPAR